MRVICRVAFPLHPPKIAAHPVGVLGVHFLVTNRGAFQEITVSAYRTLLLRPPLLATSACTLASLERVSPAADESVHQPAPCKCTSRCLVLALWHNPCVSRPLLSDTVFNVAGFLAPPPSPAPPPTPSPPPLPPLGALTCAGLVRRFSRS